MKDIQNKNIIFFDGQCNLCDRFVNFVFKRDSKRKFYYSSLQGETARQLLEEKDRDLKSIVFFKRGTVFKKTQAIEEIIITIHPHWVWLFRMLPQSLYNVFYRLVAKSRYRIFGKKSALYEPTEQQKVFFLP